MAEVNQQNSEAHSPEPPVSQVGFPPTEVTIRTMASDIKALTESGGLINKPAERIILSAGKISAEPQASILSKSLKILFWSAAAIVGILVLFFIGYYLLPLFLPR